MMTPSHHKLLPWILSKQIYYVTFSKEGNSCKKELLWLYDYHSFIPGPITGCQKHPKMSLNSSMTRYKFSLQL